MDFLQTLLNKIWKVVRVILILFFVYGMWYVFFDMKNYHFIARFLMFLFFVIFLAIVIGVEVLKKGYREKCPKCKKWFSLEDMGTELVGKKDINVKVEGNTYNRNGEVIGTQEQYVPGTRKIYHQNFKCKKCGNRCYSTFSKSNANL